jgi:hypothetical protein
MFDVGDPTRNLVLNACFVGIALLTVASLVPWQLFGATRLNRLARWIPVPIACLAIVYERAMPSRFDIRVDLLLLIPMYLLALVSSAIRWLRRSDA